MLDIGWSELLLIGVVALIVVGPKDLPVMFRTLGRVTAKARQMAREFSRAMEDAAKDTGLDGVAGDLKNVTSKKSLGLDALERATEKFEKWDPKFPSSKPDTVATLQADPNLTHDLDAAEGEFEPEIAPQPAKPAEAVTTPTLVAPPVVTPVAAPVEMAAEPAKPAKKPRVSKPKADGGTAAPKPRKKTPAKKDEA